MLDDGSPGLIMIFLSLLCLTHFSIVLAASPSPPPPIQPYYLITIWLQSTGLTDTQLQAFNNFYVQVVNDVIRESAITDSEFSPTKVRVEDLLKFTARLVMANPDVSGIAANLSNIITHDVYFCRFERHLKVDFLKSGSVPEVANVKEIEAYLHDRSCVDFSKIFDEIKRLIGCLVEMGRLKIFDPHRALLRLQSLEHYMIPLCDDAVIEQGITSMIRRHFVDYFLTLEVASLKVSTKNWPQVKYVSLKSSEHTLLPVANVNDYLSHHIDIHLDKLQGNHKVIIARMNALLQKAKKLGIPSYNCLFANYPRFIEHNKEHCDRFVEWCEEYEALFEDVKKMTTADVQLLLPTYKSKLSLIFKQSKHQSVPREIKLIERPLLSQLCQADDYAFSVPPPFLQILGQEAGRQTGHHRQKLDSLVLYSDIYQSIECLGTKFSE